MIRPHSKTRATGVTAVGAWVRKTPLRIYAISLLIAALPLSFFVVGAHRLLLTQVRERVVTQGSQSAKLLGTLLEQDLAEGALILESFAIHPSIAAGVLNKNHAAIAQHLEQAWSLKTEFESLRIYDLTGRLTAIHPTHPAAPGSDHSARDWYQGVKQEWKPYVSDVFRSEIHANQWIVAIAVPIKNRDGKVVGILVGSKTLDKLTKGVYGLTSRSSTTNSRNPTTNISFVDRAGHKFGRRGGTVAVTDSPKEVTDFVANQRYLSGATIMNIEGEESLIAYSPLPSMKWGILLQLPTSAVTKALWDYEKNLVYLGIFILLVAAGGGAFVASLYKQLRDTEQQSKLIVDRAHDAFVLINHERAVLEWNTAAEKTFGWSRAETLGRSIDELILLAEERTLFAEMVAHTSLNPSEPVRRTEASALHKDGHQIVIEFSAVAMHSGKSRLLGCFLRDITTRVAADRLLRQAMNEIADLYDNAPIGYHSLDKDGRFISVNETESGWLGYANHEVIGVLSFQDLLADSSRQSFQESFALFKKTGRIKDLEFDLTTKDGRTLTVIVSASAIYDASGAFVKSRSTMIDISERKRSEMQISLLNDDLSKTLENLEALNKDLESFTYSVSHDLRAPLRHLDGFAKILEEDHGPKLDEDARHCIKRIRSGAAHMGSLVDDLLSLARLGRMELEMQSTGLRSIVDKVLSDLESEHKGRDIEWLIGELPFVECDPSLVRQAIANLVSNALKYTRPRPRAVIEIDTLPAQDGAAPVIYVRDNGVGFNMKYVDKLFGVFQRLHREEDFEGAGVGLATVHRIVKKHGGRVWAEAELNKGATFYFTLGSRQGHEHTAQAQPAADWRI